MVDESEVVLERCLLSKEFTVFHTAAVYSWIYTVHFDRVNYAYSLDILACGTKVGVTWRFVSRERWRRSA